MIATSSQHRRILALCLAVAGLVLLLEHFSPLLHRLELMTLDGRFSVRGARPPAPEVVLVTIDEKSLEELGPWPWPRSRHGQLVDLLHDWGAAAVVFDLTFTEPQRDEEDAKFARAIREAGNVVLAAFYPEQGTMGHGDRAVQEATELTPDRVKASDLMARKTPPSPGSPPPWLGPASKEFAWSLPVSRLLEAASGVGFLNLPADPDATFRRARLVQHVDNGRLYPHLSLVVAALKLGIGPDQIAAGAGPTVRLGGARAVPVSGEAGEEGTLLIDFAGPPPVYPRYSYSEVLAASTNAPRRGKEAGFGRIRPEAFRDKIVFIGVTAPALGDRHPTPYLAVTPGVEIHAALTDALLRGRFYVQTGPWLWALLVLAAGMVCGRLLALPSLRGATLGTLLAGGIYVGAAQWLFSGPRVVLPVAGPLLTLGLCYASVMAFRFRVEFRERQRNRAYLDRYVSRPVAERILSDPQAAAMGGQRVEVSVLFSDIRGFTTLSEAMPPEAVIALLNEYFARMAGVIMRREGTLMQYVGDEIMAVWGAPVAQPDHARRAVLAGLEMLAALAELHAAWRERGLPTFEIGIGIHSGEVVAGNVGSSSRTQYAVVGDTVNTASRLEQLNKEMGTRLLIHASTYERVYDLIEARPLPAVTVRGKAEALTAYEVLGPRREPASQGALSVEH